MHVRTRYENETLDDYCPIAGDGREAIKAKAEKGDAAPQNNLGACLNPERLLSDTKKMSAKRGQGALFPHSIDSNLRIVQ